MPDYVYALHDFLPENEDEVSFRAGDRIEVVEKDDMYGDGWWQGRNLEGKVGLFPKSYTAPAAPSTEVPVSQSTPSAAETPSAPTGEPEITSIASPQPKQPTATFLSGHHDDEGDMEGPDSGDLQGNGDEVMKATMTDVQRAIEQLGRGGVDGEGSFTFASSHGGDTETDDTDFEMSDTDRANDVNGAQDWHKGARTKLAERARKAVEDAEKFEALSTGNGSSSGAGRVVSPPPIQAELSDESDDEGDPPDRVDITSRSSKFQRENPYILEEDEEVENGEASKGGHAQDLSMDAATTITHLSSDPGDPLPETDESEAQTATKSSFPAFQSPPPSNLPAPEAALLNEKIPSPARLSLPSPISPNTALSEQFATIPFSAPDKQKRGSIPTARDMPLSGLPSPAATDPTAASLSKHNSVMSSFSNAPSFAPAYQPVAEDKETGKKDPSQWTVEEVVEWLKSKGFDQTICDKFIEQEITGDVLLELDVNLLKTEIGVMAFGKRMRIANAITDLRRPPSIIYSDHPLTEMPSPSSPMYNTSTPPRVHSRTQSQSHSHHSFPGTSGHTYSQSVQSSLGSPIGYGAGMPSHFSFGGPGHFEPVAEGGSSAGDIYSQNGKGNGLEIPPVVDEGGPVGLGAVSTFEEAQGKGTKGRPSQLTLSPSDGALKDKIILQPQQHEDEDRGHMSEGEVVPSQSMRRRLFGRSHDSTTSGGHSSSKHSNGTSSPGAPAHSPDDKDTTSLTSGSLRQARVRKSTDGGKPGDRLSLFAVPFGGKSRKPPPSAGEHEYHAERSSMFGLPKGMRKSSSTQSQRPSTPTGSPKEKLKDPQSPFKDQEKGRKEEEKNEKAAADIERSTLRKRVVSSVQPSNGSSAVDGKSVVGVGVTQGQSILGQIGEPDHVGWMRKKSDRYNSWKPRYFVLKGQHLYWMKNSSVSETRLKGYLDINGYKVTVDETLDPGRYGFRIDHDHDKPTHFFSSDEKSIIREWMKAIMKATINRDYAKPVISSCNIPTIPLVVAQAMNPAPRPPSPTARDATQRALRRENPNQLSSRDARVLMGLSSDMGSGSTRLDSFFAEHTALENDETAPTSPKSAPPRPSREMRRANSVRSALSPADNALVEWANSHLSASLQVEDPTVSFFGGLAILRLAESIKGRPSSPPVPDSAFPTGPMDDKLDGLFRLFDFLLDNDVKMGSVSINDIRQGKRDKILQLLKALKSWDDKRRALAQTMNGTLNPSGGGAFLMPTGMQWASM